MKFQITNYEKRYDSQLLDLFYNYVFNEREEFEYSRPKSWIYRYDSFDSSIIKIAKFDNELVGTFGIIPTRASVNGKILKGGYFVDNCVLPAYLHKFEDIMSELIKASIEEAIEKNFKFIIGWDYLKNYKKYCDLYSKLGFISHSDINWYAGGFEYKKDSPSSWRGKRKLYWKTLFHFLTFYNKYKMKSHPKKVDGVIVEFACRDELDKIADFINKNHPAKSFHCHYKHGDLRKMWDSQGIRCLIAKKQDELVGVITFFVSTWTGLMYGKPTNGSWEEFNTIVPDEFVILKNSINTDLPIVMIRYLLDFDKKFDINSNTHGFVSALFDRKIEWKRNAYKKWGFVEAKVDYGIYLVKSLNGFKINNDGKWSIPPRAIVAPYPKWID